MPSCSPYKRCNINEGHALEVAIQGIGLCGQRCCDGGVGRPTGCQQATGNQTIERENTTDQLDAGFCSRHAVVATDDVRRTYVLRVQGRTGDLDGLVDGGLNQERDPQATAFHKLGDVIRSHHQLFTVGFDGQLVQKNVLLGIGGDTILRKCQAFLHVLRDMLAVVRIKDVDENHRSVVEDAEVGVHCFAKGEVLEIVRITQLLLAGSEVITNDGLPDRGSGVIGQVDGSRADIYLKASAAGYGANQRSAFFAGICAMIERHLFHSLLAELSLHGLINRIETATLLGDLRLCIRAGAGRNQKLPQHGGFTDCILKRGRQTIEVCCAVVGNAGTGRADVNQGIVSSIRH